jgi:ribonuclease D
MSANSSTNSLSEMIRPYRFYLPLIHWKGPVQVLNTAAEMMDAVQEIHDSGETHLGFDTETKPVFRRGDYNRPALIQLATAERVYLFRICKLINHTFEPLLPVFTDPTILKTAVGIHQDIKDLQRVMPFQAVGFVDCSTVTVNKQMCIHKMGLQAMAAHFLQGRINKGKTISNWASPVLTASQIRYAATDAWVSREAYVRALADGRRVRGR